MAAGSQINWDFIHEQEGNSKTEAYVPVCTPKSVVKQLNSSEILK